MNKLKIGNLLAYISASVPNINLRKLIKLVYLIDEESVICRGLSVTWLDYYVWEKGPVAPCIYNIKLNNGGAFSPYVSSHRNKEEKVIVTSNLSKADSVIQFSKKELKLINSIIDRYGHMSADELSEITHRTGGLWETAKKASNLDFKKLDGRSDIKLNLKDLIQRDEEKMGVYEDAFDIAMF